MTHAIPGPAIVIAAQRISADLIVIGRRGAGRALIGAIGSTARITAGAGPDLHVAPSAPTSPEHLEEDVCTAVQ